MRRLAYPSADRRAGRAGTPLRRTGRHRGAARTRSVNSTAPLISATVQRPRPSGEDRRRRARRPSPAPRRERERRRPAAASPPRRSAPSATFVRHSPGAATRLIAPITWSRGDDDPQVEPERRHELLHERAVRPVPRLVAAAGRAGRRATASSSHRSTPSPQLPNRGLTTTGGRSGDDGRSPVISRVRGCGNPARRSSRAVSSLSCAASRAGAPLRTVTPAGLERTEHPQPVVDAVERRQHVDPADRAVACAAGRRAPRRASAGTSRRRGSRPRRAPRWRRWGSGRRRRCACRPSFSSGPPGATPFTIS